jgi:hypothetical protein
MTRRRLSDTGGAVLEFAIVMPLLALILTTLLDLSLIIVGRSTAANAVREGARVAILHYDCADRHSGCSGSAADRIDAAVRDHLDGFMKGPVVVSVRCLDGDSVGGPAIVKDCDDSVVPARDVVEVSVEYLPVSISPFVASGPRTATARMIAIGAPVLTP